MSEWQGKVGKHNPDVQKQNMPKEKTQWNFKKVISGVYNGYITAGGSMCYLCRIIAKVKKRLYKGKRGRERLQSIFTAFIM
jgi:hypothetical protein